MAVGSRPRSAIRSKDRFAVFSRDGFACRYCHRSPPDVELQVDHIFPVSRGGDNNLDNLVTACFDCNIGKRDGTIAYQPDSEPPFIRFAQSDIEIHVDVGQGFTQFHTARGEDFGLWPFVDLLEDVGLVSVYFNQIQEQALFNDRVSRHPIFAEAGALFRELRDICFLGLTEQHYPAFPISDKGYDRLLELLRRIPNVMGMEAPRNGERS